ncbi:S1 family peptidase [Pilimelia columellifera]|uniref:Alpha-lytic protease prodomain-containing protein n=1 Tax=Pilimelia columellifera subsp. columellifera TaxID=706583 RepID=A0ABP6AWF9_9ACTN
MNRVLGIATTGLALGLVAAVTVPALAESFDPEPPPPPDPFAQILTAMQRDLGMDPRQARVRIDTERRATDVELRLRHELGSGYAGAWLAADHRLTVAVTSPEQAERVRATGAEPRIVKRSAAALRAAKSRLDAAADRGADDVVGWHVDVSNNAVVVLTRGDAADARSFATQAGVDADTVRVETTSGDRPRLYADVRGGDGLVVSGGRCSVGLAVEGGFITAGHCGTVGEPVRDANDRPLGTIASSAFPGDDYAYVRAAAGVTAAASVNDHSGGSVAVLGSAEAPVGASVCRSGATTGWRCGVILAKNATANYAEGKVSGLTRTDACAEPGDSGGPWMSGQQAQGLTSGGSGNCADGGVTYFQPANEALAAYGLTLSTQLDSSLPEPGDACAGLAKTGTVTVAPGVNAYQPNATYHISRVGGEHRGCADGPAGTQVSLALEQWTGKKWITVASAEDGDDDQRLRHMGTPGYYRYRIAASGGDPGQVAVGYQAP